MTTIVVALWLIAIWFFITKDLQRLSRRISDLESHVEDLDRVVAALDDDLDDDLTA